MKTFVQSLLEITPLQFSQHSALSFTDSFIVTKSFCICLCIISSRNLKCRDCFSLLRIFFFQFCNHENFFFLLSFFFFSLLFLVNMSKNSSFPFNIFHNDSCLTIFQFYMLRIPQKSNSEVKSMQNHRAQVRKGLDNSQTRCFSSRYQIRMFLVYELKLNRN